MVCPFVEGVPRDVERRQRSCRRQVKTDYAPPRLFAPTETRQQNAKWLGKREGGLSSLVSGSVGGAPLYQPRWCCTDDTLRKKLHVQRRWYFTDEIHSVKNRKQRKHTTQNSKRTHMAHPPAPIYHSAEQHQAMTKVTTGPAQKKTYTQGYSSAELKSTNAKHHATQPIQRVGCAHDEQRCWRTTTNAMIAVASSTTTRRKRPVLCSRGAR